MNVELSRRLGRAFYFGRPDPADRLRVIAAAGTADTFADLPDDVRRLVLLMEHADEDDYDPDDDPDFVAREPDGLHEPYARAFLSAFDRAAGHDTHPGGEELKRYWLYGEGAGLWSTFTELRDHLVKHMPPEKANRIAASWFHERYQMWPGDDRNRVKHGKPPRGDVVGPG